MNQMILMTTYCYKVTRSLYIKDIYIYKIHLNDRVYKSISQLNPEFMWFYFTHKDMSYSLRKGPTLDLPKIHSFYYSTNAAHSRGSFIWNNLPAVVKPSDSLFEFSNKIKYIGNNDCEYLI